MNVNLPRKYFLSRKVALNTIDVCHNAKGVPVIRRPAVVVDNYAGHSTFHKPIPSDNGYLLAFYGESYYRPDFHAKSFCEKEGAMEVSNEYVIKFNCNNKDLLAQNFTNDLKYAFVLSLSVRSGCIKSSKSELFLNVVKFHKVVMEGVNVKQLYNGVFDQDILILKSKNKLMPRILRTCVSSKGNYLCLLFAFHEVLESHLFIYNIDFENNSASFERSVKMDTLSVDEFRVELEMNENESFVLTTQQYRPIVYRGEVLVKAVLYFLGDHFTHKISLEDSESDLKFCCYLDHNVHGYLIFMLGYNRSENNCVVVEILKWKTMTLERWEKVNVTEEFGLGNHVGGFAVQGVLETRMFLSYSNQFYVIDVFSRTLVYVIDPDVIGLISQLCVNWNGQEIFIVREQLDWRRVLQCYYLPRKDEFSLRHTAAISVMANYSVKYLKSLNLPKIIKCLLNIA